MWNERALVKYLSYAYAFDWALSSFPKGKGKNVEANFAYQDDGYHLNSLGMIHLDIVDFFDGNINDFSDGKTNLLVDNENDRF